MEKLGKQNALEHIDPTRIKLNDDKLENSIFRNARTTLKKEEMATNRESIRKIGLLKPIIVRPIKSDEDGYGYQLVCGSRRLRNVLKLRQDALAILKEKRPFKPNELCFCPETSEWLPATEVYATIKCFVRDCDDEAAIVINIAENLEHSRVPEMDMMEFCQELVELKNKDGSPRYSRTQIANMCNRCESWVSLTLDLNKLPERVKQLMAEDRLTRTAALSLLQTERSKIDAVIDMSEKLVREEKLAEAEAADKELEMAEVELSDAQNDVSIHELLDNPVLRQMAEKREGTSRKRVSAASEKRDSALKAAAAPKLTQETINKSNLLVEDAKKKNTKPKTMPAGDIRSLYAHFKKYMEEKEDKTTYNVVNALFETILGHKAYSDMKSLIGNYVDPEMVPSEAA